MTADRFPRAGKTGGLHFAMGYSGHRTPVATHMGDIMADVMTGRESHNPWDGLQESAVPEHFGQPWFLPIVGGWAGRSTSFVE